VGVTLSVTDGIGTISLNRPPVNALDVAAQAELQQAAFEAASRDDVAAVVIYGGPDKFSAGADIRQMAGMSHSDMLIHAERLQAAFTAVADIPKPVVAAITGFALGGGCELAQAADRRVFADHAQIGLRDSAGRDPGRRWHTAARPIGRSGTGEGADLYRSVGGCR
jgi:enoyl-CoA hydratase/carnithine racemase